MTIGTVMINWLRLLVLATLLSAIQPSFSQEHKLLIEGIDGKQHALSDYVGKGKWVVVNVWATGCPYCRRELFDLASFHDRHHDTDAIVVGLTLDLNSFGKPDKEYLSNFASSYLLDYPILLVSGELASKVIGSPVNTVPMTFFYQPDGELFYQINGELTSQLLEDVTQNKRPFLYKTRTVNEHIFSNYE